MVPYATSPATPMTNPITISLALMCCAFLVAVAYVAIDERV
ncbi:MAG: hypothetical protein AAF799_43415 [Myxococcota bacterium]